MIDDDLPIKRRTVLKSVGTAVLASAATGVGSATDATHDNTLVYSGGDGALVAYVYNNEDTPEDHATLSEVTEHLDWAFDKAMNFGLGGYEIYENNAAEDENFGSFKDFRNWVDNHNPTSEGVHLLLDRTIGADDAGYRGPIAYGDRGYAYVDLNDETAGGIRNNLSIHEVSHGFIDKDSPGVSELLPSDDQNEHYLGVVKGDGCVTPMATKGTDTGKFSSDGTCNTNNFYIGCGGKQITNCTADALGHTYDDYN